MQPHARTLIGPHSKLKLSRKQSYGFIFLLVKPVDGCSSMTSPLQNNLNEASRFVCTVLPLFHTDRSKNMMFGSVGPCALYRLTGESISGSTINAVIGY